MSTPTSRAVEDAEADPIFVVCAPRSGSTLFRALLNRHPALHIVRESHFWCEIDGRRFAKAPSQELNRYFSTPPFRWLRMSPESVLRGLPEVPSRAQAFLALMQADAKRHGKTRCGDKTPAHAFVLAQLLRAFPRARYPMRGSNH